MFDQLTDKLSATFRKLTGGGILREDQIDEVMKEIRRHLLEADVHFKVARDLCESVKQEALGQKIFEKLSPGQQVVQIFHKKLVEVLGGSPDGLPQAAPEFAGLAPVVVLVAGLQGSGKTTFCAKLALYIKKKLHKTVGLLPADCARPAAKQQLLTLANRVEVPAFDSPIQEGAVNVVKQGLEWAKREYFDVLIVDTAGRTQVDDELMQELQSVAGFLNPAEKILVIDAMIGSQGLEVARAFHEKVNLTGLVLSKLDGDARGGVALSARAVTQVPIYFASVGEKPQDLEAFHPDRMASRVLGMGDVMTLIEKAQETFTEEQALESAEKIGKGRFTLEDFLAQMKQMQNLGPLEGLMKMIPGASQALRQMPEGYDPNREMKRMESMILSMTREERLDHTLLNGGRKLRISKGSGVPVSEINRFIKQFMETQKMMRQFSKMGLGGSLKNIRKLMKGLGA